MTRASWAMAAIVAAGCGGGGDEADAPPPDAPRADAAPPTPGGYVMDSIAVPRNTTEAQQYGLDIDCGEASMDLCPDGTDITKDNQLGSVFAALSGMGFDLQAAVTTSIDRGGSINLVYRRDSDATVRTYAGANPMPPACTGAADPVCRHHLDGTASFDLATGSPTGAMPVAAAGPPVTAGPGTATLSIVIFDAPITVTLIGGRARFTPQGPNLDAGVIGGAIADDDVQNEVIPGIAAAFRSLVQATCSGGPPPDCGCPSGSSAETMIDLFDTNPSDCLISDDEVRNNSLIMSLFAPDVTIDGTDALSLGVGFTAVPATFTFTPP